jgi:nucleoside-diphosphate-sugar epimerase
MTHRVALLGAGGFIGSRIVEMFHLGGLGDVRPVVRSVGALARLSRFDLESRVADALDQRSLRAAFEDCECVIHAISGDPATIRNSVAPVYRAAQQAGVRRIVYLSSASVHGQAPPHGTDEGSPVTPRQPIAYNNAKAWAERRLLKLREKGSVEIVILRPGIVTGPRSIWQMRFARDLLAGTACWLEDGRGICNSLYVDNLVHAIHLALARSGIDGMAFLLGDEETVTWADLYRPVAQALGFESLDLPNVDYRPPRRNLRELVKALEANRSARAIASLVPKRIRRGLFAAMQPVVQPSDSTWAVPKAHHAPLPVATLEMSLLYRCRWKLPDTRARQRLGYTPVVSFAEGCRRTIGWLEFAGFPVIQENQRSRSPIEPA